MLNPCCNRTRVHSSDSGGLKTRYHVAWRVWQQGGCFIFCTATGSLISTGEHGHVHMSIRHSSPRFFPRLPAMRAALLITLLATLSTVYMPAALAANQELPVQNSLLANPEAKEQAARISRRDASDLAREVFPGRVLSIRLDEGKWRVRMDQEGTVFNVLVDASSGEVNRSGD